jgi:hypothetical protein
MEISSASVPTLFLSGEYPATELQERVTLLSHIWDFPFRRLLRLAGSRWRYSNLNCRASYLQGILDTDQTENTLSNNSSLVVRGGFLATGRILLTCLFISAVTCLPSSCIALTRVLFTCLPSVFSETVVVKSISRQRLYTLPYVAPWI